MRLRFCARDIGALLCDPRAGDMWHITLPMSECHILAPSSKNDCAGHPELKFQSHKIQPVIAAENYEPPTKLIKVPLE